MATGPTRGVVYVHSAPAALCPHVEWALAGTLGMRVDLPWVPQPAAPGTLRAELSWTAPPGAGARLATALRGCRLARFEVTEEPSPGADGERYAYTPRLGLFSALTGVHGDLVVPEERLRAAVRAAALPGGRALPEALDDLLGRRWDDELEPFRLAGEGAPVRWLHQVG